MSVVAVVSAHEPVRHARFELVDAGQHASQWSRIVTLQQLRCLFGLQLLVDPREQRVALGGGGTRVAEDDGTERVRDAFLLAALGTVVALQTLRIGNAQIHTLAVKPHVAVV